MGYMLVIGNAVPKFNKHSFPKLHAYWEVDNTEIPGAPCFPKEVPKYFSFNGFKSDVGLSGFFDNVLQTHCFDIKRTAMGITQEHANFVSDRLNDYKNGVSNYRVPGWEVKDDKNYEYNLQVLIWLEWWMKWAVKNCETPAIQAY